ncbi:MAG TPA: hypothetical protein VJJ76_00380 [archaeon]|nr:hypothetical protein [archaeon]
MSLMNVKCPKCGKTMKKRLLKITHGRCSSCNYLLASSLTRFSSARTRIRSKYGI